MIIFAYFISLCCALLGFPTLHRILIVGCTEYDCWHFFRPGAHTFLFVLPNFEMQHTLGNVMYIYSCIHACILTSIHTYLHTHSHIHTYIHTYVHTCMHIYIHTYIQIACCLAPVQGQNRNFLKRHFAYAVPPVFIQFLHHMDKYIRLQPLGMVANKIN